MRDTMRKNDNTAWGKHWNEFFFSFLNQDAGYQLPLCLVDPISVSTIALILFMPFARRDIFYNSVFPILVTTRIMKYKGMKYKGQYSKMENN